MPQIAMGKHPHSFSLCPSNSGDEQVSLDCCGVDRCGVFIKLLSIFKSTISTHFPDPKTGLCHRTGQTSTERIAGTPREIDAPNCLGLVLFWFRTQGSPVRQVVPMTFGLTASFMRRWLKFHDLFFFLMCCRTILLQKLKSNWQTRLSNTHQPQVCHELTHHLTSLAPHFWLRGPKLAPSKQQLNCP